MIGAGDFCGRDGRSRTRDGMGMGAIRFEFRVNPFGEATEELFPAAFQESAKLFEGFQDGFEEFLATAQEVLAEAAKFVEKSRRGRRFGYMRNRFHGIIIA